MSSDEAFVVRVLAALKSAKLEAIVVGNVAAILQGVPVTTQDLDLLIRDTPRNQEKIVAFGRALGGRARKISPLTSTHSASELLWMRPGSPRSADRCPA